MTPKEEIGSYVIPMYNDRNQRDWKLFKKKPSANRIEPKRRDKIRK